MYVEQAIEELFFFHDTAPTEIYTLSLHDALPISNSSHLVQAKASRKRGFSYSAPAPQDRKSTRLNSSHTVISYAVFCLKKKKQPPVSQGHIFLEELAIVEGIDVRSLEWGSAELIH